MMPDPVHNEREFDILAAPSAGATARVLKHGETFSICDRYGDLMVRHMHQAGVYHHGTRFLSRFVLEFGGARPSLLSSTVIETNDLLVVDLTNPAFSDDDGEIIPHGAIHLLRSRFVWKGVIYERIKISNYASRAIERELSFWFGADFADIFEVRGMRRRERGQMHVPEVSPDEVVLAYEGLDRILRRTSIRFHPRPDEIGAESARFRVTVPPHESVEIEVDIVCEVGRERQVSCTYEKALKDSEEAVNDFWSASCRVTTSNEQFNNWMNRSMADLIMLISDTPHGPYPYAGVPWYSTVFGRDGLITALQLLWVQPRVARGVLAHLAATQATARDEQRDAEPGKIIHEMRDGEMANLDEIPFGRYYGTIDASPLFVMLAGAYFERTGDLEFVSEIWPNIEAALKWIDADGDVDGDGFVEYERKAERGLQNQGWKDSWDSVFHADGKLAEGPIALCEVQAYVYAARRYGARFARLLGNEGLARSLEHDAERLRERFDDVFWMEDLQCYALALDGKKRPCRVRTSNAGHALTAGIAYPHRAKALARTLASPAFFSGWGIRTLASTEPHYNPMAYHNGSIWPHDSSLIAYGLASYGLTQDALRIAKGLFEASTFVELHRLPELFCGFVRRRAEGPTGYPVACAPQAWAAGACFLILQSLLGLSIDGPNRRVTFRFPVLPEFLHWVQFGGLQVGDARIDILAERYPKDVSIRVLERSEDVEIVVVK